MQSFKLSLKRRPTGKTGRRQLDANAIQGVVYGPGIEAVPLVGDYQTVQRTLKQAGTSHIIQLDIDEADRLDVLVKELDHEPVSNRLRHFDLLALKKGEKINVEVPIVLVGESPAAKLGNVVHQLLDSLEVHTTPDNIPESFTVDISGLSEVGDTVHVSDLDIDQAVEIEAGLLEQPIVKIDEVRELEVEDVAEEVAADEIPADHGEEGDGQEEAAGDEPSTSQPDGPAAEPAEKA